MNIFDLETVNFRKWQMQFNKNVFEINFTDVIIYYL